jgi:hypothetical protein
MEGEHVGLGDSLGATYSGEVAPTWSPRRPREAECPQVRPFGPK